MPFPAYNLRRNMVGKIGNPIGWITSRLPKNQGGAEGTLLWLLKLAFWAALLAPVILLPAYYLLVNFGVAPQIHLPPG